MARRALKKTSAPPENYVVLSAALMDYAQYLTRMRKPPDGAKRTMKHLSKGLAVHIDDARNACFEHAIAAITANGQSMGRREDGKRVQAIWHDIQSQVGITPVEENYAPASGMPDPNDTEAVAKWLAS